MPHDDVVDVAVLLVPRGDTLLFVQRTRDPMKGYWELPGGKVEEGETAADAARRELHEETGLTAHRLVDLGDVVHAYAWATVRLHAFEASADGDPTDGRWRHPAAWTQDDVLPGTRRLLAELGYGSHSHHRE